MGTAPRSPAQERKICSRKGTLNQTAETNTDAGRAIRVRNRPAASAVTDDIGVDAIGEGLQPKHHEQPDLGDPADAFDERAGRGAVRQLGVAEQQRADVDRREAAGVQCGGDAVREDGPDQDRQRVEAGGGQRDPTEDLHPDPAEATADGQAADQFDRDQARQRRLRRRSLAGRSPSSWPA